MSNSEKIAGIFDKKSFYEQYYFIGSIESQYIKITDLNIYLEFKKNEPSKIKGMVIGDFNQFEKLMKLNTGLGYCTLRSKANSDVGFKIFSKTMFINNIKLISQAYSSNPTSQRIASFSLCDVTLIDKHNSEKKYLNVFYDGMYSFSQSEGVTYNLDGSNVVGESNKRKFFKYFDIADISFKNCYFYYHENQTTMSKYAKTASFSFSDNQDINENVVTNCLDFFEHILLVASFVENNSNQWFAYKFSNGKELVTFYKSTNPTKIITDVDDSLLPIPIAEKFIDQAIPYLKSLQKNGIDLLLPIRYLIIGSVSQTLEVEFINYFTALEKLKDMYSKAKEPSIEYICGVDAQRQISKKVLPILEAELGAMYNKESFSKKLISLYRNTTLKIVKEMLKDYQIKINDLFPKNKGNIKKLIDTRDKLIHSSEKISSEEKILNRDRLKAIVQRVVLKMLGWEDIEQIPSKFVKRQLQLNKVNFIQ